MVAPYEFEYNGYLFNTAGSPRACVTDVAGLDLPPMRISDVPLQGAHGSIPGLDRLDVRTVDMSVDVIADGGENLYGTLLGMSAAVQPRDDELPLVFQLDESLPAMRVNCRPRRRNIPLSRRHVFGNVRCDLQWVATDPLIYSDEEHSDATEAASDASGWAFNWSYPRGFGAGPGEAGDLSPFNAGTAPTKWVATVFGPVVHPTINGPDGHSLHWEGELGASEFIVFDAHAQTVLVGGTSSQYQLLSVNSEWFELQPGDNSVAFLTENGLGTIELRWRDAWWSAT